MHEQTMNHQKLGSFEQTNDAIRNLLFILQSNLLDLEA